MMILKHIKHVSPSVESTCMWKTIETDSADENVRAMDWQIFAHPRFEQRKNWVWNRWKRMQTRRESFLRSQWKAINPFVSFCLWRFYQFSSDNKSFWPFDGMKTCHCFTTKKLSGLHTLQVSFGIKSNFLWENNFCRRYFFYIFRLISRFNFLCREGGG